VKALPLPITPFPFQSKTKYKNTLGSTFVLALAQEEYEICIVPNERETSHDQRYEMSIVCNISIKVPRI
jgi:hypothetical protein